MEIDNALFKSIDYAISVALRPTKLCETVSRMGQLALALREPAEQATRKYADGGVPGLRSGVPTPTTPERGGQGRALSQRRFLNAKG